ncbi:MAG: transporter substrate-binding domain-containing protein [Pseudolabrys sp.]
MTLKRKHFAAIGITMFALLAQSVGTVAQTVADPRVADLVKAGKVRIGVFPSFQYSKTATGQPQGLAIGISRALSSRLGLGEVVTIEHPTPPKVIECVKTGECDFGFMLIDPARATEVDFTPPFVRSDFTYLLPANSSLQTAADVDRSGVRIAAVRGHASTIALLRVIKQASPVYAESYETAVDLVRSGKADAFASIREMLMQYSAELPGSRVLGDSYQKNFAGIAVAKNRAGRLAFLTEFLDDIKRSGELKKILDGADLRGVEIASPKVSN